MIAMDNSCDIVKNYSKCPLKKRPVLMDQAAAATDVEVDIVVDDEDDDVEVVDDDIQCEPENLSTKPEDLSKSITKKMSGLLKQYDCNNNNNNNNTYNNVTNNKPTEIERKTPILQPDRIYVPKPTYAIANTEEALSLVKNYRDSHASPIKYLPADAIEFKNWSSPLTPPIAYAHTNDVADAKHWPLPAAYHPDKEEPIPHQYHHLHHNQPFHPASLYHPYTSPIPSIDLRHSFNNNIIKPDLFTNAKRFTPYRVDRPIFNMFPLSPASSQASSYNSYESPRRSVSPVSSNSSITENLPSNYSVFQNVAATQNVSPISSLSSTNDHQNPSPKHKSSEKSNNKSAHYQCPDCSKSYSTYSGLSKHLQFHCPAVEGNQAKKNFSCKNCEKVYTSLGALKMHIRTHTLPCKCDICGKAFSRPWLLQGHIRTHTGEKPFNCQHCHRAFADRSNLRAHLQTHSEIKKYSCTTCAKTFSRMSLLTKHMEVGCPGFQINPAHHTSQMTSSGLYPGMAQPNSADISVY